MSIFTTKYIKMRKSRRKWNEMLFHLIGCWMEIYTQQLGSFFSSFHCHLSFTQRPWVSFHWTMPSFSSRDWNLTVMVNTWGSCGPQWRFDIGHFWRKTVLFSGKRYYNRKVGDLVVTMSVSNHSTRTMSFFNRRKKSTHKSEHSLRAWNV